VRDGPVTPAPGARGPGRCWSGGPSCPPAGSARRATGDPEPAPPGVLAAHLDEATAARLRRMRGQEDRDRGVLAHSLARRAAGRGRRRRAAGRRARTVTAPAAAAASTASRLGPRRRGRAASSTSPTPAAWSPSRSRRRPAGRRGRRGRAADGLGTRCAATSSATTSGRPRAWPRPGRERFAIWARKEAAVKASGHGLALGLSQVLTVRRRAVVGDASGRSRPRHGWDLDTARRHVGAVGCPRPGGPGRGSPAARRPSGGDSSHRIRAARQHCVNSDVRTVI
jgi:hypothetical protein